MSELTETSVSYSHDGVELIGFLVTGAHEGAAQPGVLLIHDAMGVSEPMKASARGIASEGYTVFLADLWGGGVTPMAEAEIGPLIGSMASERERWVGRIKAGHDQLLASVAVAEGPVTVAGYCFGGASALEYVRTGGAVAGAVSIHGGLDLVSIDWSHANSAAAVLILTGAEDPMAAPPVVAALEDAMSAAEVSWEVSVYGQAKHAFTNPHADRAGRPEVIAYHEVAARRARAAVTAFLAEMVAVADV